MPLKQKLSIIVPVYNEEQTIEKIVSKIKDAPLPASLEKEIIIVDDCSSDGTRQAIKKLTGCTIILKDENQGKGAAVRDGLRNAEGDFIVIQDADLEYDPKEYSLLLEPLLNGQADIVYGSRFLGDRPHRVLFFWHYAGNKLLTLLSNLLTNLNLSDMETCYKCFNARVCKELARNLSSNRFGIEPEITAIVARKNFRVYEVGISYFGRTYQEGKKINWKDGLAALWFIFYYNLIRRY